MTVRRITSLRREALVRRLSWARRSEAAVATATKLPLSVVRSILGRPADAAPAPDMPASPAPAPVAGGQLLDAVRAAVGRRHLAHVRDEIVGEAILLALEGESVERAVKRATTSVRREDGFYAYGTRPIEECFWL